MARVGNKKQQTVQHEIQFPYDLAELTDIANAILVHEQRDASLVDAISLVEMLIRRRGSSSIYLLPSER